MDKNKTMPKNEDGWKKVLTPEQYAVLRQKGTEAPFSGKLLHEKRDGTYTCAACGNELFSSDAKFDSGTGWPSFDQALPGAVKNIPDNSHGAERTEIVCARCGSHVGHVFDDLPATSERSDGGQAVRRYYSRTGKRYCLNSVCLDLEEKNAGNV